MKFLKGAFFLSILLLVFVTINTLRFSSKQSTVSLIKPEPIEAQSIKNFSNSLKIKTISHENPDLFDATEFERFNQFLYSTYPSVFQQLKHTTFNQYSHLLMWQGSDTSLKPIILMGHHDVVPIASPNQWNVEPFSGTVKDGIIWGRGTIDNKITVIGLLEATSYLLQQNFQPRRSIYFAFGHDEEIGGELGATSIANYLLKQGVEAEFVLDEGLAITQGIIPGLSKDAALIGIAEKGFTSLELSIELEGGHSSMPAKETAIDVIAQAVTRLKQNPLPRRVSLPMEKFMDYIGPEMQGINKVAFANPWLFKSMILDTYEKLNSGNALIRTTTSPTMFSAGIKENVIPTKASAVVNYRIIPGETIETVLEHARSVINDPRIKINKLRFNSDPSPVSSTDNLAFITLQKTIQEIYPETIIGPNLVVGATDSRHFQKVSQNLYRFMPYKINDKNIGSFHGINEQISVQDFEDAIRFYMRFIKNSQK